MHLSMERPLLAHSVVRRHCTKSVAIRVKRKTGHVGSDARIWEIDTGVFFRRLGKTWTRQAGTPKLNTGQRFVRPHFAVRKFLL